YNFGSGSVTAGQTAKLTVSTSASTQSGTYIITVAAAGSGLTRKTTLRLSVFSSTRLISPPVNATRTPGFTVGSASAAFVFAQQASALQVDSGGTVHITFADDTAVATSGNDVFYSQSSDGGKTYSNPIKLSTNGQ